MPTTDLITSEALDVPTTIGIDVGGTKILGVVVAIGSGTPLFRTRQPTPKHRPSAVPTAIGDVVADLLRQVDAAGRAVPIGIGVGVPGLVDRAGVLHYGPNVPGVLGLDISGVLTERFGLPVFATNDANNAATAEHRFGAARGVDHAVVVTQGTGIGGAIIVDGHVVRGVNGFAGEPGHMLVDRDGHRCACGQLGCWESVASGAGLVNLTRELVADGRAARIVELAGGDPALLRGEHVAAAVAEHDPDALEVIDRFSTWVAVGIASLVNLLDPEVVVLGGGLTNINSHFLDVVRERLERYTLGGPYRPPVRVLGAELGPEAGAIGGAITAADRFAPNVVDDEPAHPTDPR